MKQRLIVRAIACAGFFFLSCTELSSPNNGATNSITADNYEPDNTQLTAKRIYPDSASQTRTLKKNDTDWVSFSAVSGKSYRIFTSGNTDTRIKVCASSSTVTIVEGDDSPGSLNASVVFNCTSSGTYYICVTGNDETASGAYLLSILSSVGLDYYEPDSLPKLASSMTASTSQSRSLTEGDVDWIACYITSGDTVLFTAAGTCRILMTLYDRDTMTLLSSAPTGDSIAQIKYRVLSSGTYFVKVSAQTATANGNYRLTMQTSSSGTLVAPDMYENDNTRSAAKLLPGKSVVQQRSLTIGDTDWVFLPVIAGRQYTLTLSNSSYSAATMYAKDGTVLQGPSYSLFLNSSATDTVYVRITATVSTAINYLLNLTVLLQPTIADEYEVDNTKAQAKAKYFSQDSLIQDRTLTVINSVTDTDWVAFPVFAGKQYTFKAATSSSATLYMYLYDNISSSYIKYTSSSSTPLSYTPTVSDTMYLMVYRPYSYGAIAYSLSVQGQFYNDSYEPDSSRSRANALTSTAQSHIILPGDTDWVMYTSTPGDSFVILTTGTTDTKIALFSSSGSTPLIENDDIGNGNTNAMISWKSALGGLFYVRVTGKTPLTTGSYVIQVQSVQNGTLVAADSFEIDNTKAKARIILDTVIIGEIHSLPLNDTDWVAFPVVAGGQYTVTASSSASYLTMYVYNSKDSLIASRISYTSASVSYVAPTNDTIYYRVTSASTAQRYTLSMTRIAPPKPDQYENDNSRGLAKPIKLDSLQSHSLSMLDTDWVKIEVAAGNSYRVTTAASMYHYVYLYLGSSVSAIDYNYGLSTSLTAVPAVNDTLFVQVRQYSASTSYMGPYTIKVTKLSFSPVKSVSASGDHSMFLKSDGTLWATGNNTYGQLGDGTSVSKTTPVQVATGIASVSAGYEFTMFIKTDSTLWAMGNNSMGQLGIGTTASAAAPVQIMTGVRSVSAGYSHTLILKNDGAAWATGYNSYGQLGDGTMSSKSTPVQVMTGVASLAAGYLHSLFVKSDGTLWTSGYNYASQLGDGSVVNRSAPVQVLTNVASVAGGVSHSLALKKDNTLWGFGSSSYGQLGADGTSSAPVQIMTGVSSVSAGSYHSLVVKSDSTLWVMGENDYGQLGTGGTTNVTTPVQVSASVASVSGPPNGAISLFVKYNGTAWGMGSNALGMLGDGTTATKYSPTLVIF